MELIVTIEDCGVGPTLKADIGRSYLTLQGDRWYHQVGSHEEGQRKSGAITPALEAVLAEAVKYLAQHGQPTVNTDFPGRFARMPTEFVARLEAIAAPLGLLEGADAIRESKPPGLSDALGQHLANLAGDN